jgi:hypothetical protein
MAYSDQQISDWFSHRPGFGDSLVARPTAGVHIYRVRQDVGDCDWFGLGIRGLVEAYAEYDFDHVKPVLNVIALEVGRDVLRPDGWGAAGDVIAKHITADDMEGTPFHDYVRELVEEEEAAAWASTPTGRAEMYADRLLDEWKHDAA